MMSLLDPLFELGMAKVLTFGAHKYSKNNWMNCDEPFARYYSALRRHLAAYATGSRADGETGLSHLYHAAVCLMFLAHFEREDAIECDVADEPELTVEDVAEMGRGWNVPLTEGVE
jgi:hypothetical protein